MTSRNPELQDSVGSSSINPNVTNNLEMKVPDWCDDAAPAFTRIVPVCPSQAERDLHEWTLLLFRSSCSHCAMGKAVTNPHRRETNQRLSGFVCNDGLHVDDQCTAWNRNSGTMVASSATDSTNPCWRSAEAGMHMLVIKDRR